LVADPAGENAEEKQGAIIFNEKELERE